MNTRPIKTRIFKEGEGLTAFIVRHIPKLKNGSILAVTSKVVALAEGRVIKAQGKGQKAKLIRQESEWAFKTHPEWWLTIKNGSVVVNAGIDDSNADGRLILLPRDSFNSANVLRKKLRAHYKIKHLGIVITDSRITPLRAGVTGLAVGYAGFRGVRDYRGRPDIFGRTLKVTMTDVADSLATAAALVMGEGSERQPLAIIEDAPVEFTEKVNRREVLIPAKDDMYRPFFRRV